jgi:hypothetical protein
MRTLRKHLTSSVKRVLESWVTWIVIGAASTTAVLSNTIFLGSEVDQASAPTGLEIEAAVAQAEAQANAARQQTNSEK